MAAMHNAWVDLSGAVFWLLVVWAIEMNLSEWREEIREDLRLEAEAAPA